MEPRNFSAGASASPPTPLVSPSVGYPTAGNPGTGTPATKPGPHWYHQIGEELRNLVLAAGLTPNDAVLTQVSQAVQILIAASVVQDYKASVRVATTANIAGLGGSAPNTLDGVTLLVNDRILVKDQSTASQNGIYAVTTLGTGANGTWTRATDADGAGELTAGAVVLVEEGTANADSQWMLTTDGTITIGTTPLTFTRQGGRNTSGLQPLTATAAAGAMTITLAPTSLDFRSTTLITGGATNVANVAPITLVVPATTNFGLATANGTQRLPVLALNNAGAMELALGTLVGGVNFDESALITTVAIGSATTNASVGSTTARTSLAQRVVGFVDALFTTGTGWTISQVQPAGGLALAAISSLGYGQTWQNLIGSRSLSTTYYNTTGRPISLIVAVSDASVGNPLSLTINGVVLSNDLVPSTGYWASVSAIVPPGASYILSIPGSPVIQRWAELR